ncbi:MAG: hypothetical protein JXP34_29110 [Planctomycetes bacterium]|nr:hypothetical protein [Planctomycetota bacterium]
MKARTRFAWRFAAAGAAALGGALLLALTVTASSSAPEKHPDDPGVEPIVFVKPLKAVIFDHSFHVMQQDGDCEVCHDELFDQERGAAQRKTDFDMKTMEDEGTYCGRCHDVTKACTSCHIGRSGLRRFREEHPAVEIPGLEEEKAAAEEKEPPEEKAE